eukprot:scaffold64232_cov68-Phaeocystis_antarctica.AAC.3
MRCKHAACATSHAVKSSQSTSVSGATSALRAMLILSSSCTPGSSCRLRMLRREWPLSIRGSSTRLPSVHRRAAPGSTPPLPPPLPPPLLLPPGVVSRVNATSTQEQFICFRSHRKRSSRTTAPTSLAAASASSAELPASWARVRLPVATSRCRRTAAPPSAPHSAIPRSPSTVSPTASVGNCGGTASNSEFIDRRGELRMLNTKPASPRTSYGAPSAPLKSMSARVRLPSLPKTVPFALGVALFWPTFLSNFLFRDASGFPATMTCPHGRRRNVCKECGGGGICEHGRRRNICKDCGGSSICEHGRVRYMCKECSGSGICEHGRQRHRCTECGGSGICEHGRRRSICKECGGSSICEHGRQRQNCKDCGGGGICEHGRQRRNCKECGGSNICEHGRRRNTCKECGGSSICEHGRVRGVCKDCGGGSICEHRRVRHYCKDCDGHVVTLEAIAVEECEGEEEPDERRAVTVQARMISGPRGGKRKR